MSEKYPEWICGDCGEKHGNRIPSIATWHEDVCGWCGDTKTCTEPRDYGYPEFFDMGYPKKEIPYGN